MKCIYNESKIILLFFAYIATKNSTTTFESEFLLFRLRIIGKRQITDKKKAHT